MDRRRMIASLRGVALGDALGQLFFGLPRGFERLPSPPPGPWRWTDDTHMALSIVRVLHDHGRIDQDALVASFAAEHRREPWRGYARGTASLLQRYRVHLSWREEAPLLFGSGSFGNGAAMRVAPLGAAYSEEPALAAKEAAASAEVTHAHAEGVAGAIAVAVAAAMPKRADESGADWLQRVIDHIPAGDVRRRTSEAASLGCVSADEAARRLGCGFEVTAHDTVPFCLWIAAFEGTTMEQALVGTLSPGGDRDTTGAIVAGILAAHGHTLPSRWLKGCEPLPRWVEKLCP